MIRLTDGKRVKAITMMVWQGNGYTPCLANDFFEVGNLESNEDGAYIVPDLDYCVEMAMEWEQEDENNAVFVEPAAY